MPARSQAQRRYLNAHFGHAWVKEHGFDNSGPLPARVGKKKSKKRKKGKNVRVKKATRKTRKKKAKRKKARRGVY